MSNYFEHEYKLEPIVEDFYRAIEKHLGNPTAPRKLTGDKFELIEAFYAAMSIWGCFASRGRKLTAAGKLNINRNTLRKYTNGNKFLAPVKDVLYANGLTDMYALKHKMGLGKHGA